jgi:hypothetical protein
MVAARIGQMREVLNERGRQGVKPPSPSLHGNYFDPRFAPTGPTLTPTVTPTR